MWPFTPLSPGSSLQGLTAPCVSSASPVRGPWGNRAVSLPLCLSFFNWLLPPPTLEKSQAPHPLVPRWLSQERLHGWGCHDPGWYADGFIETRRGQTHQLALLAPNLSSGSMQEGPDLVVLVEGLSLRRTSPGGPASLLPSCALQGLGPSGAAAVLGEKQWLPGGS